ncbi:hypothetical protein QE364_001130 [Nocardioides zeae]|uniref:Uncharacterized protein n=1 Tax=Nocardioides zeae TaxID=1457234 RepID=A0ACC6IFP7_9ACTN|nr:hypothetical protein [Nocardioides zeae]MDR6209430.1 hypothetical protein [Nocardioides zeae]
MHPWSIRVAAVVATVVATAFTGTAHAAAEPLPSGLYPEPAGDVHMVYVDSAGPAFTPPPLPDSRALPRSVDILSVGVQRTEAITYVRVNIADLFGFSKASDRRAYQDMDISAYPHSAFITWDTRTGKPAMGSRCNSWNGNTARSLPITWSTTQEYVLFRFDNSCEGAEPDVLTGIGVEAAWYAQKLVNNRPSLDVRRQWEDTAQITAPAP